MKGGPSWPRVTRPEIFLDLRSLREGRGPLSCLGGEFVRPPAGLGVEIEREDRAHVLEIGGGRLGLQPRGYPGVKIREFGSGFIDQSAILIGRTEKKLPDDAEIRPPLRKMVSQ